MDANLLKQCGLFLGMDDAELNVVARLFEERTLKAGTTVFIENMPGESLYLIEQGRVQITRMLAEGDEQVLASLGPEEAFGEMAVLDDAPRSATARVQETAILHKLSRDAFERFCAERPDAGMKMLRNIVRLFSRRVRESTQQFREMILAGLGRSR